MVYFKCVADGYLISVGIAEKPVYVEISEAEYVAIKNVMREKPVAVDGFEYRLTSDLRWELHEVPIHEAEATEADYLASLERFGVR